MRGGSDTGVVEMFLLPVWGGVGGGSDTWVVEMFLLPAWGCVGGGSDHAAETRQVSPAECDCSKHTRVCQLDRVSTLLTSQILSLFNESWVQIHILG